MYVFPPQFQLCFGLIYISRNHRPGRRLVGYISENTRNRRTREWQQLCHGKSYTHCNVLCFMYIWGWKGRGGQS